jgi:DNA-binding beta-propeller fold protein YncE
MDKQGKPLHTSSPRVVTLVGVLVALGLLVLVGRLQAPHPKPVASTLTITTPTAATANPTIPGRRSLRFAEPIGGLAVTPGAVWVAHGQTISRLDPHTLRPTATVTGYRPGGDQQLVGMTAGAGAVWVTVLGLGVLRVDPASARVVARILVTTEEPPAVGAGAVWVVCCGGDTERRAGRLVRIDPATNRVAATISLHGLPDAVGAGPSGIWVRGALGPVWRIDPASNRLTATITVPGGLGASAGRVLVGRDGVWVSDPKSSTVYQLDPQHNRLGDERFEATGAHLLAAADLVEAADGTAWVVADGLRLIGIHGHAPVRTLFADDPTANEVTALAAGAGGTVLWAGTDMGTVLHLDPRAAS